MTNFPFYTSSVASGHLQKPRVFLLPNYRKFSQNDCYDVWNRDTPFDIVHYNKKHGFQIVFFTEAIHE